MKKPKTTTVKSAPKTKVVKAAETAAPQAKTEKPAVKRAPRKKAEAVTPKVVEAAPMLERVGLTAGEVWHYLDKNGATTVATLIKELAEDEKVVQRSIGWLAQEDKLSFTVSGRVETISLK